MKKDLDITKPCYSDHTCQSLGPSLFRGSTVYLQLPIFDPALIRGPGFNQENAVQ